MNVKRYMEVDVSVCDFCGKETYGGEWLKCMVCGRHICGDCNIDELSYRGIYRIDLCPECRENKSVKEVIEKVREVYGIRD